MLHINCAVLFTGSSLYAVIHISSYDFYLCSLPARFNFIDANCLPKLLANTNSCFHAVVTVSV
jgi:hypothetical protein